MYAARNNFAVDTIYWERIDQRFFGRAPGNICDLETGVETAGGEKFEPFPFQVTEQFGKNDSNVVVDAGWWLVII